jgi:hypothetical protein
MIASLRIAEEGNKDNAETLSAQRSAEKSGQGAGMRAG